MFGFKKKEPAPQRQAKPTYRKWTGRNTTCPMCAASVASAEFCDGTRWTDGCGREDVGGHHFHRRCSFCRVEWTEEALPLPPADQLSPDAVKADIDRAIRSTFPDRADSILAVFYKMIEGGK